MSRTPEVPDDLKILQGTWVQTACEADGIKNPTEEYGDQPVTTIRDCTFIVRRADGEIVIEGTFSLDPATEPKSIDWQDTFGADAGKTFPAIYELDGDMVMFCAGDEGDRPTEFRTRKNQVCRVLKRVARSRS